MKYMRAPAPERFERLYIPEPNSGCWLWLGSPNKDGYGRFRVGSTLWLAHRFAKLGWYNGHDPSWINSVQVLHRCDNPACVNPEHLFFGTHSDNMQDMVAKGRNAKKNRAKLKPDQIEEIKKLARHGIKHAEIAKLFDVTRPSISNAVAGRTWGS